MSISFEQYFDELYSEFSGLFPEYSLNELEEILEGDLNVHGMILDEFETMYGEQSFDIDYVIERIISMKGLE